MLQKSVGERERERSEPGCYSRLDVTRYSSVTVIQRYSRYSTCYSSVTAVVTAKVLINTERHRK